MGFRCLLGCLLLGLGLRGEGLVLATYAQAPDQVRKAEALVASLRAFGGPWRDAEVHVVHGQPAGWDLHRLEGPGVTLHPIVEPAGGWAVPYAFKVQAAAQVEGLLAGRGVSLAWFDPETLILAPPRGLVLPEGKDLLLQPAFKRNAVALGAEEAPEAFWSGILRQAGLRADQLPLVRTLVEGAPVRAYYNCGVFSVRPERGLLRAWDRAFRVLCAQPDFLREACPGGLPRVFLHQAVFSAQVVARIPASRRALLSKTSAYPLHLQKELSDPVRVSDLGQLDALILEDLWDEHPGWREGLRLPPNLEAWLEDAERRYHTLAPGVLREERGMGCNSLLVETSEGDVLVDPGGTDQDHSFLLRRHGTRRLCAILLTHGHLDHRAGLARWLAAGPAPVVAHRSQAAFLATLDRVAPVIARRTARMQGRPPQESPLPSSGPPATEVFDTEKEMQIGAQRIHAFHAGGETPDTSLMWFPGPRVLCMGDDFFQAFPALATPRGTQLRPAAQYLAALDRAMGLQPEILVPGHGEPLVGGAFIRDTLRRYRGALAWVLDATVQGLREGRTVEDLVQSIRLPGDLSWPESYGRVAWAVRAIAWEHLGWFDGRTTSLYEVPPSTIHPVLVAAAGGSGKVMDLAEARLAAGAPLEAMHLLDLLPTLDPRGRDLRRTALKTLLATTRNHFQRGLLTADLRDLRGEGR